ncbi:hypothetical protein YC2023_084647 [Brassica napus]
MAKLSCPSNNSKLENSLTNLSAADLQSVVTSLCSFMNSEIINPSIVNSHSQHELNIRDGSYSRNLLATIADSFWLNLIKPTPKGLISRKPRRIYLERYSITATTRYRICDLWKSSVRITRNH